MSMRTPFLRRPFQPLTLAAAGRSFATFAALAILVSSCSRDARTPVAPAPARIVATPLVTSNVVTPTLYASGVSPVTTWDPILAEDADLTWTTTSCTTVPAVSRNNPGWVNPHAAFVNPTKTDGSYHPWVNNYSPPFTADWINAWNALKSIGPAGQSWTKYTTPVSGVGAYVLELLADNCSWVYINDQLVGVQPNDATASNTKYSVTLAGDATLSFIIFDGGRLAGGKFRLETYSSYIANGGDPSLVSAPPTLTPTTTTVSFGAGPFPYTGTAYTATATVSTGATATIVYAGDCVNAGNTCTATAAYAGDATHAGSNATANITIAKLPSTTTVSFGSGPFVYSGAAFTATSNVSPSGTASIVYAGDCTNAGNTCAATATYAGDANHLGSNATTSITITKAPSTTTVSFGAGPFVYKGSAFAATASVNPAGTASIVYAGDCTNAGNTCAATATYTGDANHLGSTATANLTIAKAPSATAVTFGPGPFPYTGTAYTATATVTPSGSASIAYAGNCVLGGTSCVATATYTGDPNHTGSQATAQITITYTVCAAKGDDEHVDDGKNGGIKAGRTLPVKLRVCDAKGRNISAKWLQVKAVGVSPSGSLNDSGKANPGNLFRLDDDTYMFNLSTKGFSAGNYTLDYTIGADPTVYHYAFTILASTKDDNNKDGGGDKKP